MNALRNAACGYADRGWHVLPLRPRTKVPLTRHGKDDATSDLATVFRWWRRSPNANVGISAGASGLVVLDVDPRNGGDDSLHDLERQLGPLPVTVSAETGGGGQHYAFKHPGGDLVGVLEPGLDVKDHGYFLAAPSVHPSGRTYEWDLAPDDVPLADLPEAWLARMRPAIRRNVEELTLNVDHADPLRRIPAATFVGRLARREVDGAGWAACPFHGGGKERTPSLHAQGTIWACYACNPIAGRRVLGGNIYDFAGLLAGYAIPLRGVDFLEIQARLDRAFEVER